MKNFEFLRRGASCAVCDIGGSRPGESDVVPGTQVRVMLSNGLSTSVAHNGDPFTAIVAEPVFIGNQIILPAGAKIHGTVTSVQRPKWVSMFRGGASMNLVFNSIEVESRIFPARMSILSIYAPERTQASSARTSRTVEGVVVQERHDVKTDVGGYRHRHGRRLGCRSIFSRILRGTVIGLVGGSAYVVAKKGKEVELPAQTGLLVRMDSTVSVPSVLAAQCVLRGRWWQLANGSFFAGGAQCQGHDAELVCGGRPRHAPPGNGYEVELKLFLSCRCLQLWFTAWRPDRLRTGAERSPRSILPLALQLA